MTTLIVPCAGKSSRFPNMKPKWMLTHPEGMLMLEKNLSAFDLNMFDKIVITIVKEHDLEFFASKVLKQAFPANNIEVHILNEFTNGPAETVYKTIVEKKIKGSIVVRDSDSLVRFNNNLLGNNFAVGMSLKKLPEIERVSDKSFIVINEFNKISNIIEKEVVSENICLGVYGFRSELDFLNAFEFLFKEKKNNKNEIFVSHIMSFLLGSKKLDINYDEASYYEDWGTFSSWKKILDQYTTYFIDLDGVIVKNVGKYGEHNWDNYFMAIKENVDWLRFISNSTSQVILTTSRPEKYRSQLENFFMENKIKIHSMVMGLNHSPRVIINDFAPTNPYPSCKAISIERDDFVEKYFN